ncbi:MAG: hypothetical protein P9M11_05135 [Candidatus Tenebribacter burtonii]|nr:hypothetical protein [Candidatus Tenebribacter burtonii]
MKKYVFSLVLLLIISAGLHGQFGYLLNYYEPEIIDAKAEALGKTSILSSSGANYLFNNPAKLSNLKNKNIQVNARVICGKPERKHQGVDLTDNSISTTNHSFKFPFHAKLNGISAGLPIMLNNNLFELGIGAGYRTYYDWGFNIRHESKEMLDDELLKEKDKHDFSGGFSTLVLGSGLSYRNKIFAGVSISFPFISEYKGEHVDDDGDKSTNEGSLKGTFYTIGVSYKINEILELGSRVRTGFKLEMDGESGSGNNFTTDSSIPAEFGFAIKLKPKNYINLYFEYLTRDFGSYEKAYIVNENTESGYVFRTGCELGTKKLIRFGFFMQSVPVYETKSYYDELLDDYVFNSVNRPQNETGITAGYGFQLPFQIDLNLFGTYSFLNFKESYNFVEDYDVSNDLKYSLFRIGCSLGYSF